MFIIREGRIEDCNSIMEMIKELAVYEQTPDGPKINSKILENDGFGQEKYFHTFVCENTTNKQLVGFCLYFYKYSTWHGRFIWMNDIYVKSEFRNHGLGTELWQAIAKRAEQENCPRLEFGVLNWNQPSIDFYKRNGAVNLTEKKGWNMFRLDRQQIELLANKKTNS